MENIESNKPTGNLFDEIGRFITIPYTFIHAGKSLSLHARWLFVALRYYTNGKSGVAFPSYATIGKLTGMRREKISSSIKELENNGWLERQKRFNNSTIYKLILPRPSSDEAGFAPDEEALFSEHE